MRKGAAPVNAFTHIVRGRAETNIAEESGAVPRTATLAPVGTNDALAQVGEPNAMVGPTASIACGLGSFAHLGGRRRPQWPLPCSFPHPRRSGDDAAAFPESGGDPSPKVRWDGAAA